VVTVLQVAPALRPEEVLAMDAVWAVALCGERARQLRDARDAVGGPADADRGGDGRVVRHPDGSQTVQIRSLDTLRGLLAEGKRGG
jgi:hypothetical protein